MLGPCAPSPGPGPAPGPGRGAVTRGKGYRGQWFGDKTTTGEIQL